MAWRAAVSPTSPQSDSKDEFWTIEGRIQSALDGRFNFLVGGIYSEFERDEGDYFVNANSLDIVVDYGAVTVLGLPPLYPGVFDSRSEGPGLNSTSKGVFGEVYFDVTSDIKLTAGLRYTKDEKKVKDAGYLYNSLDLNFVCVGVDGNPNCAGLGLTPLTEQIDDMFTHQLF